MKSRWVVVAALLAANAAIAGDAEWRGELALEGRHFLESPLDPAQHGSNLSLSGEIEFYRQWDGDRQSLTI